MKRNVSLEEISDGRLYGINDMVKADCHGCKDCFKCCCGMGESIILDPLDCFNMTKGTGLMFTELLNRYIELNVVDGVILPNIHMKNQGEHESPNDAGEDMRCGFLDENGRCGIHTFRPGICRLFPLGRYYENGDYKYFLQVNECAKKDRTKIKVSKWINEPDPKQYHDFVVKWHYFLNRIEELINSTDDDEHIRNINMAILNTFYVKPWDLGVDFYGQFNERYEKINSIIDN